MALNNPRWLIDGQPATQYVLGRRAEMAVDVTNFLGGNITFQLWESTPIPDTFRPVFSRTKHVDLVGYNPVTVSFPVTLNHQWRNLGDWGDFSILRQSWQTGEDFHYPINEDEFQDRVTDDLLFPHFHFEVFGKNQSLIQSGTIRRDYPKFVDGNSLQLFIDGNQALPAILQAISSAQHHIHLNWFFFSPDEIGIEIIDALMARAAAGVKVRLLFDKTKTAIPESVGGKGVGSRLVGVAIKRMKAAGIQLGFSETALIEQAVTDPEYRDRLRSIYAWSGQSIGNLLAPSGPYFDFTDHCKYIVIDGIIGLCGGMNVGKEYLFHHPIDYTKDAEQEVMDRKAAGLPEAWIKWHDHFALFKGPAVRDLQKFAIERWAMVTGEYISRTDPNYFPAPATFGPSRIKVVTNVPGLERDITAEYLRLFSMAATKIRVETPYFTDDLIGLYLAQAAKSRGIPVELIVPDKHHDLHLVWQLMRARYDEWRANKIKLYEFQGHMAHVKMAATDSRYVILGSYNLAKGSAMHLYECNIVVEDPQFATEVEQRVFDVDKSRSKQITGPVSVDLKVGSDLAEPYL